MPQSRQEEWGWHQFWSAWKAWVFRRSTSEWGEVISPTNGTAKAATRVRGQPGERVQQLMTTWLQPPDDLSADSILKYQTDLEQLEVDSLSWSVAGRWIIELPRVLESPWREMTALVEAFWPAFKRNANPWILDKSGNTLSNKKYDRIQSCTVEELHITRTAETTYAFSIPVEGAVEHQQAKLRRWGLPILLNAPTLAVGAILHVRPCNAALQDPSSQNVLVTFASFC